MFGIHLKSRGLDVLRAACRNDVRLFNKGAGTIAAVDTRKICELWIVERQTKRLLLSWIWLTSMLSSAQSAHRHTRAQQVDAGRFMVQSGFL